MDIDIQRRVALECLGLEPGKTGAEWIELPNRDHFFTPPFPELVDLLDRNVAFTDEKRDDAEDPGDEDDAVTRR